MKKKPLKPMISSGFMEKMQVGLRFTYDYLLLEPKVGIYSTVKNIL